VILYEIVPSELPFALVNSVITKKELSNIINECYRSLGTKATVILADRLKDLGYKYATISGISISSKDMVTPQKKAEIIGEAESEVKKIERQYSDGLITDGEN
jgi:DNA-directed RNA polymerase subunit beta'